MPVTYKGSHGTTRVRAGNILKSSFRKGPGRHGTGAYFWLESPYYFQLAIDWFNSSYAEYVTEGESKPECAIIVAELMADDSEVLDLDNRTLRASLMNLVYNKEKIRRLNSSDRTRLFDSFIRDLERELHIEFKIVLVRTAPPQGSKYPLSFIGPPDCGIARDVTCIKRAALRKV